MHGSRAVRMVVAACVMPLAGCAGRGGIAAGPDASYSDLAVRIVEAGGGDVSLRVMIDQVSRADVVFFGEQHDDPETHRVEAEVLDAVARSGRPVVLSLEMFERDVQPALDEYLAGRLSEREFLLRSRPWERYAGDYRRLVETARTRGWRVVAANVPRPIASAVGRTGLAALDTLSPRDRAYAARDLQCPRDDYYARFMESMQGHSSGSRSAPSPGDTLPTAMAQRFYLAQCVKDETMAESVVAARLGAPGDAIVVHFDGAFHSDYAQGTVSRVRRRQPTWKVVIISAVPAADPGVAPIATHTGQADFLIFTRQPKRP